MNSTVMSALSQRTREEQRDFFALWNAFKTARKGRALLPALGIFETNALPCGSGAGSEKEEREGARTVDFLDVDV